jgi:glycosyltransferase involved in cell wall biosynthesis
MTSNSVPPRHDALLTRQALGSTVCGETLSSLHLGDGWPYDRPGGLNRYVRDLVAALNEASTAHAIVIGPGKSAPKNVRAVGGVGDPLIRRLFGVLSACGESGSPDIVDSHFPLYAALPILLTRLRKRPLIVHFHGPWASESEVQGDRRATVLAKRFIERYVYSRASEFVVLSRAFGRVLVERYGVSPWRISVIPPGTDLFHFAPGSRADARRSLGIPESAWVVVTVRRLVPRMGLDILLEAWADTQGDQRLLLVVGDGPLEEGLRHQAAGQGLADRVRFLGRVDDRRLVECYRAADACAVPSVALEGFGLVVLEALACGTPVIVTDAGGLPEVVSGLSATTVVPAGDRVALAARLRAAADGSNPLPSSERCRSFAEQFTWSRAVDQHLEIYGRVIHSRRRKDLRVVYLTHSAALSGAELSLLELLPALSEVETHVILGEEGPLVTRLLRAGISAEVLPLSADVQERSRYEIGSNPTLLVDGVRSSIYALRLARRLRHLRPDLVHTISLKAALYGGIAGRLARVPVVWQINDRIADDYLGTAAARLIQRASAVIPEAVMVNSDTTRATLEGVKNCSTIGVPIKPLSGDRQSTEDQALVVGMVGRIAPWKGQKVFIDAFADAFPTGSERALVIGAALFGADERAYEQQLQIEVERLGLVGRVSFTGFREDMDSALAELDILVHASVLPEPFGRVVVEGMSAGLPVVAADAGGPGEIIEHEKNGLLYPPGDREALARALRCLADDPGLRARLGASARKQASLYSPEVVAERVMRVYKDVLASRRRVA